MKINWGTGIVIAIVLFIGFIMVMVVTMITDKRFNHDFVTDNYYKKELQYQGDINAMKNVRNLPEPITVEKIATGLQIKFPSELNPKEIKGKVFLYRPSNKKLDFEMPISITNTYLLVPDKHLLGGRWNMNIAFKYKDKDYLHREELMY